MAGIIGAIGAHGFGKTLCLTQVARGAARAGTRVRFVDQWRSFPAGAIYSSVGAYRAAVTKTGSIPRAVAFRPTEQGESEEGQELAVSVAELVTEEEGGLLIIDEIDELVPPRKDLPKAIRRAALRGNRNPETSFAWGTQYPFLIRASMRSQTDLLYVFRMTDEDSLKWLRKNLGAYGEEVAAAAPTLAKREGFAVPLLLEGFGLLRFTLVAEPGDFAGRELG